MKILVLAGSGEFTAAMDQTDQYLLSLISDPRVAILPTAAGLEDTPPKWIADGIKHFEDLGVDAFGIPVLTSGDADNKDYVDQVQKANFFYLSGGDPGHLLKSLKDSMVWRAIYRKFNDGAIIAGSSAGAMVMGNYVLANAQRLERNKPEEWKQGFGLVPVAIFPHFNKFTGYGIDTNKILQESPHDIKDNWMGIDEDTVVVLEDNVATIYGKGEVMLVINGRRSLYHEQDSFTF